MENFAEMTARLTDGLRTLPTDAVARVRHFLAEYLGDAQHPVPFGGREGDVARLDNWLADLQAPPYALLAAPAGRGKSALLLRWCQRLLAREELAVVYFPVSIRFRTNVAGVVFPALVALLASIHGEQVPADPNVSEQVWQGLLLEYTNRPLPDGRRLLLVLDGVDEAADWEIHRLFLTDHPPAGLRVMLSARSLASDQDASSWLQRLGWRRPGLAQAFRLYPLDRAGIASVLIQMGFPLDTLGSRVDMVTELYRLSEGDPLLLRLYVDDLWERGEQVTRLQPGDLLTIRPGLAGYFERWWDEQRLLWGQEASAREAALQTILNLLAGALGPLSAADLCALIPAETDLDPQQIEQQIKPLARFVIGDGQHQGYVFSHPRLAGYFLEERLSEQERQEVEARFLAWGSQVLHALRTGHLAPSRASSYIVQYYGVHLERTQAGVEALRALVSDGWRRAWEKLDRANAGFLGDSERAWRAARQANQAAVDAGEVAPYLDVELRSLFCRVSMNSMISNISPRLMLEAVRTGLWTPAQGLASVRLITDLASRARELVTLAPLVQEPLRTDIQQEALDTVASLKDAYARLDLLVELAPHLPEHMLLQVLAITPTIEDEADRAGLLAEIAPALAPYPTLLAQVLHFAEEIEDEEYSTLALTGIVSLLDAEQRARVWQLADQMQDERYRSQILIALLPHLPESTLQEIALNARQLRDTLSRLRLLTALASHVTASSRDEVVQEALALTQEIDDLEYRVEIQLGLASWLGKNELDQALKDARSLWDEQTRARALIDLLPFLADAQMADALEAACTLRNEEYRSSVLISMLPRLAPPQLEHVLKIVRAIWDEGCRAQLLARMTHSIPAELWSMLLEAINDIGDPGYSIWVLAEIETSQAVANSPVADLIARKLRHISSQQERLQALLAVVDRLSDEALKLVFRFMLPQLSQLYWYSINPDQRTDMLCKLAPYLPASWLSTALDLVKALGNEIYQARILLAFEPRMSEIPLTEVLDIVRTMRDWRKRSQVLEVLISALPATGREERVREMIQVLQILKDDAEWVQVLNAFTGFLPDPFPTEQILLVLASLRAMPSEAHRLRILEKLVPLLPAYLLETVMSDLQKVQDEEAKVTVLKAIAAVLPEEQFPALLEMGEELRNERLLVEWLSQISAHLPQSAISRFLEIVEGLSRPLDRARTLEILATRWPEAIFARREEIFPWLEKNRISSLLGILALYLPETYFARLLSIIADMPDEQDQIWILGALVRHMQPDFASEALDQVLQIKQEGWRGRLLKSLIPALPADAFSRLLPIVQQMRNQTLRESILDTLVHHTPEAAFLTVLRLVLDIDDEQVRRPKLVILLMHTPESAFPQCWELALAETDSRFQNTLLIILAERVPATFFPRFWTTLSTEKPGSLFQEKLLERLAERVPEAYLERFWDRASLLTHARQENIWRSMLPHLSVKRLDLLLNEVRSDLQAGKLPLASLLQLLPRLSEEQALALFHLLFQTEAGETLEQAFAKSRQEWHAGPWEQLLAALLPRLPATALQTVLPTLLLGIQKVPGYAAHSDLLVRLAAYVPQTALPLLLKTTWLLDVAQNREQVLTRLFPTLTDAGWLHVFAFLDEHTQDTEQLHFLLFTLHAAVSSGQSIQPAYLLSHFHQILAHLTHLTRREALAQLGLLAPLLQALGGRTAVAGTYTSLLEIGSWWP